jgi:MFS family permease
MTNPDERPSPSHAEGRASPWIAFRYRAFTVVWIATVVANVGTWMYNAASGWLMTSLNPDPLMVSLVQVAGSLPMFLFALPAGALADTVDKRHFLIGVEIVLTVVAAASAALVWLDLVTPSILLLFTFLLGAGAAFTAPAWQSVVPQLVPKHDLAAAVASNGVGVNISRAIGPALGGVVIGGLGIAAPFWINALSNFAVIGALLWWRPLASQGSGLPSERLTGALVIGFRHARYNANLRATLIRAVAFFFFASAYWALLPLVARNQIAGGPELYGILLGAIGIGAVVGAFTLPSMKTALGSDQLVAAGTLGTALSLVLLGIARHSAIGIAACAVAGVSWIAVLASLNVSVQMSLLDWVRGRGLAMFVTVFFGAMTAGSALWGGACLGARLADGALHRRRRRCRRNRGDLALEASVRCGSGPRTLHALAGAGLGDRRRWRSRSGIGNGRVPRRRRGARRVPRRRPAVGSRAPAGWRIRLGRFRGYGRARTLPRDLHGHILASRLLKKSLSDVR